ncbi:porin [Oceanobacter mangrovi]|uniref:porin n=1 Tax=Oceanobacter mangrovi TaxID=2862510 RepID=UPI001C8EEADF|nr:porin [Oceanobacter mangrovi]
MKSYNKKILAATVLMAGLCSGGQALAETNKAPELTGKLNVGILQAGSRDYDVWAFKADLGIKGMYTTDSGLKLKYEFVADYAGELNGIDANNETWSSGETSDLDNGNSEGDVDVHTARIFVITDYGLFLVAPRTISGQWAQLYGNVDKFEYNRMHGKTGPNAIFAQIEQANDVVAYISPEFGGGFRFIGAALTIDDYNGEDADALVWRVVYKKGDFNAGVGNVQVSDKLVPETYNRSAATAGYDFGSFSLGATFENNDKHPSGNFKSYAVVGEMELTNTLTASLGYANKNHKNDALDNSGVMAKLKYTTGSQSYMYVEGGQYEHSINNFLAGISIGF